MNKDLRLILASFKDKDYFTIAEARDLPGVSRLSVAGVHNLLSHELARPSSRLGKVSYGVYCVKKEIPDTGILVPTSGADYLFAKYVGTVKKPRGYLSGLSFLNAIGFSDDVPGRIEIVTNLEKSRGREVQRGSERAYLRHPSIRVTSKNVRILPVFDVLSRGYSSKDPALSSALGGYLKKLGISKENILDTFESLPSGVRERINVGRVLDGFMEGRGSF